jgi:hypothetical protein
MNEFNKPEGGVYLRYNKMIIGHGCTAEAGRNRGQRRSKWRSEVSRSQQSKGSERSFEMRNFAKVFLVLALCLALSVPAYAGSNSFSGGAQAAPEMAIGQTVSVALTFNAPYEVKQIRTTSTGPYLQVGVMDCCIIGDMWVQRTSCMHNGSIWDVRGKGYGDVASFTGLTLVFKKGTQPIDCITEVRYGEGVSTWPAGMTVRFNTAAGFTVNTTNLTTLVPLASQ